MKQKIIDLITILESDPKIYIAKKMAVTQRSVNRILQKLKQKNIIEVSKNSIRVTDFDALVDEINIK